jgi:hypothetical protein
VWDPGVMENITALGHELGYHYEDLAIARGDLSTAMAHFETRLAQRWGQSCVIAFLRKGLQKHNNTRLTPIVLKGDDEI